jgi:hypothetical protein
MDFVNSSSHRRSRRVLFAVAVGIASVIPTAAALGQMTASDSLTKILTDPDKLEELKKERQLPPIQFFRSQILPNDILPYIKANHWTMVGVELRSNYEDYDGMLQTRPVLLANQPHEMIYRRTAILTKGQSARLTFPMLLPTIPKEIGLQLVRPDAIQQDEERASLKLLEPHQQLVVIASNNPNDPYNRWSQLRAALPTSGRRDDPLAQERQRYYRFVLPLEPDKPLFSSHPLTWTPISHVIWDQLPPEKLGVAQQQAMLDWLHWGGQLVIVGGAGPAFAPLRESFLAPYLPAEPTGENVSRSGEQLKALSEAYPPPAAASEPDEVFAMNTPVNEAWNAAGRRYRPTAPIRATEKKPIFFTGLQPRPGSTVIGLGGPGDPPIGVEWHVGRGRVLMLAVSLTDPDFAGWPGFDTFVRRVVLRRPEEKLAANFQLAANGTLSPARYADLRGPDLTTVRYLARDLGAPSRRVLDEDGQPRMTPTSFPTRGVGEPEFEEPVGEWLDSAVLPDLARQKLEQASGIEIPGPDFVLKVILAYLVTIVPLNWLICRYVLGKREWAWVVVPTLSLAFAIGVERAAAYDVGYDSSCDEVDVLETHGDYTRGHLSRFASLYSTGRVRFTISYPNEATALALPLASGRSLRGEDSTQSTFQSLPNPALSGFQVQPRSLSLFRAEQMTPLPGTVTITPSGQGPRTIQNALGMELEDAWVVKLGREGNSEYAYLGALASGAQVPLGSLEKGTLKVPIGPGQLDPGPFLKLLLERSIAQRDDEVGELRLIARAGKPMPGQEIEPVVDRHRGFTLVVAHLEPAPLPDPASPRYNALAEGPERPPAESPPADIPAAAPRGAFNSGGSGRSRNGRGQGGNLSPGMMSGGSAPQPPPAPAGSNLPAPAPPPPSSTPGQKPDAPEADRP